MITSISLAATLAMAAYAGDPMDDARKAYSNCLVQFSIENLALKTSEREFRKAAKTACGTKRKAFHDIVTKDEVSFGSSKSEAEQYADEEIQGILDGFVSSYGQHLAGNTRPVEQN